MPVILALCLLPVLLGAVCEYAVCRFTKRRPWRWALPLTALAGTVIVFLVRYHGWSADAALNPRSSRCAPLPGNVNRLPPLAAGLAAQGD